MINGETYTVHDEPYVYVIGDVVVKRCREISQIHIISRAEAKRNTNTAYDPTEKNNLDYMTKQT